MSVYVLINIQFLPHLAAQSRILLDIWICGISKFFLVVWGAVSGFVEAARDTFISPRAWGGRDHDRTTTRARQDQCALAFSPVGGGRGEASPALSLLQSP